MPLITTEYDVNKCQCCGHDLRLETKCVCDAFPEWYLNENGDAACGYHKAELFTKESTTIALGVSPERNLDPFRNYRTPGVGK